MHANGCTSHVLEIGEGRSTHCVANAMNQQRCTLCENRPKFKQVCAKGGAETTTDSNFTVSRATTFQQPVSDIMRKHSNMGKADWRKSLKVAISVLGRMAAISYKMMSYANMYR